MTEAFLAHRVNVSINGRRFSNPVQYLVMQGSRFRCFRKPAALFHTLLFI